MELITIKDDVERQQEVLAQNNGRLENMVLQADSIWKSFGGNCVLKGTSLSLRRGEVVLLRGDNGSGKTTLLNILTGNLQPDHGVIRISLSEKAEIYSFPKPWWSKINPIEHFIPEHVAQRGIGRSWQEIRLFRTQSLKDNIALSTPKQLGERPLNAVFRPLAVRNQERSVSLNAIGVLEDLGLQGREQSSADMVSLGQAKRVAIARAVQAGARILFLDEPLAGLDETGASSVIEMLQRLAETERLSLVIVEHIFNIPRILDFSNTVWTLDKGTIKIETPEKIRTELQQNGSISKLSWISEVVDPNSMIQETILPGRALLTRVVSNTPVGFRENLLQVDDLVVHRGKRRVIGLGNEGDKAAGLSFSLGKSELLILQAPNGWGKTTLLETIVGLNSPTNGKIKFLGKELHEMPAWERRAHGLSLLQARNNTFPGLTVREALSLSDALYDKSLEPLLERQSSSLSGGEKQRVAMKCALGHKPLKVVMMDEPFSALDPNALREALNMIKQCLSDCGVLIAVPGQSSSQAYISNKNQSY